MSWHTECFKINPSEVILRGCRQGSTILQEFGGQIVIEQCTPRIKFITDIGDNKITVCRFYSGKYKNKWMNEVMLSEETDKPMYSMNSTTHSTPYLYSLEKLLTNPLYTIENEPLITKVNSSQAILDKMDVKGVEIVSKDGDFFVNIFIRGWKP